MKIVITEQQQKLILMLINNATIQVKDAKTILELAKTIGTPEPEPEDEVH